MPSLAIPFVPIIQEGEQPFSMLEDLETKYEWVLPTLEYDSIDNLRTSFERAVLDPARDMSGALMERTGKRPTRRRLDDAPQN